MVRGEISVRADGYSKLQAFGFACASFSNGIEQAPTQLGVVGTRGSGAFGRLFREKVIGWLGTISSAPSHAVSPETFFAATGVTGFEGDLAGLRDCPIATTGREIIIASSNTTHTVTPCISFCLIEVRSKEILYQHGHNLEISSCLGNCRCL